MFSLLTALLITQAPAGEGWRLSWAAPAECAQGDAVAKAIEQKLGRPLFSEPARRLISGVVTRADGEWRATLTLADVSGVVFGTREVSAREPACTALDARILFIMGLLIQPTKDSGPIVSAQAPVPELPVEPPAPALLPRERTVLLHLESSHLSLQLFEVIEAGRGTFGTAERCTVPCDRPLRAVGRYYLGGDGVVPAVVDLERVPGPSVTLSVEVGSLARRTWGVVGVSLGASSVLVGLLTLLLGSVSSSSAPGLVAAGAVLVPLGGVSIGLGSWAIASSRTVVTAR